jgi:hypothetical protein
MEIERISGANVLLGAPEGWDAAREGTEIVGLPALRTEKGYVSQWRPTAEEIERLAAGAPILLSVLGCSHPPVAIGVGDA